MSYSLVNGFNSFVTFEPLPPIEFLFKNKSFLTDKLQIGNSAPSKATYNSSRF